MNQGCHLAFLKANLPNLAFFETAYGQIWPFNFFGPGNPGMNDNGNVQPYRDRISDS